MFRKVHLQLGHLFVPGNHANGFNVLYDLGGIFLALSGRTMLSSCAECRNEALTGAS